MVTSILECSCFRTFFQSLSVYRSQTLLKHALHHFHSNFPLICKKLSWKISLLVRSTILGLLGNTFTADHMYSGHRWEKLPQQVQTLSSQQSKDFREFYSNIPVSRKFWAFRRKRSASWLKYSRIHLAWGMWSFNTRKLLFYNTLPESKSSRVSNTAETSTALLVSQLSMNLQQIEFKNISPSQNRNIRTVW